MENNQTDFMKNRPPAAYANQVKDVYGSQKSSTRTTITVLLTILLAVFVIISAISGNIITLSIFSFVLIALIISLIIGYRADKNNAPIEPHDQPEAIFKEHDI